MHKNVTNQSIWNLLTVGKVENNILYTHLDDDTYMIHRDIAESIVENVERYKGMVHIIHSNLGK